MKAEDFQVGFMKLIASVACLVKISSTYSENRTQSSFWASFLLSFFNVFIA